MQKGKYKRTSKIREKMSKAHKGIITWNKGRKLSKEHKEKLSKSHKGKKLSVEHKKKISESLMGEKCYLWRGGIDKDNRKIRKNIEYRLWREAVFARDNWICQKCGKNKLSDKEEVLCSHHIQNFSQFSELRFAIDNGITLCKKCHDKFHKKYGNQNNNKGQFDE